MRTTTSVHSAGFRYIYISRLATSLKKLTRPLTEDKPKNKNTRARVPIEKRVKSANQ